MSKKKLLVANWKMNMTVIQSLAYLRNFIKEVKISDDVEVVICPTTLCIEPMSKLLNKDEGISLGAQNAHWADFGTYTGEVSATMLSPYVKYCIVGHSERRSLFHETDKDISKKIQAIIRNDIKPIICVGENLHQKQQKLTNVVVHDQVLAALAHLTHEEVSQCIIAYEPIWSISNGDGNSTIPKSSEISSAVKKIKKTVEELYGEKISKSVKVIYGASSNPENIKYLLDIEGIEGALVGGASLNYQRFADMIKKTQEL